MEEARCRVLFLALFTPMLTIEGNVPRLRARSAHFVSHLPIAFALLGKLAEGSDELGPMIGNWAKGSDTKEFLRLVPLLERKLRGKGWKSVMHLLY
jgi:hypothetical protein